MIRTYKQFNQFLLLLVFFSSFSLLSMELPELPEDMQLATDEDYADFFDALEREQTERKRARSESNAQEQEYVRNVRARLAPEIEPGSGRNITQSRTWQGEKEQDTQSKNSTTSATTTEPGTQIEVALSSTIPLALRNQPLRQNILRFMDTQTLGRLAAAGRTSRNWADTELTPITLSRADITRENLEARRLEFARVRSLTLAPVVRTIDNQLELYTNEQINLVISYFPNITHLTLAGTHLSPEQLITMGQAFPRLVYLDLASNNIESIDDITGLSNASFAQSLRSLNVADNALSPDALGLIGSTFNNLTYFNIANNYLNEREAIGILAGSFPHLVELDLSENIFDASYLADLAGARFAQTLRRLNLRYSYLTSDVLTALGNAFVNLTHLDISDVIPLDIYGEEHQVLDAATPAGLVQVNIVDLLTALVSTPLGGRLEYLNIANTHISAEAVEIIAQGFTQLNNLVLGESEEGLSLAILRPLANARFAQTLRALTIFSLRNNDISAVIALITETFPQLVSLSISRLGGSSSHPAEATAGLYLLGRAAEAVDGINLLSGGKRSEK